MNILVIDAYTDGNVGAAALVENSISLLKKLFPHGKIQILAQFPEPIAQFTGLPTFPELFRMPYNQPRLKQAVWFMTNFFWMLTHAVMMGLPGRGSCIPERWYTKDERKLTALNRIRWADIVVSIGAERINDNFYKTILFSLYMLWTAKLYRKPLVLFPQTVGPFHFHLTEKLSAAVLESCDLIFLRDAKSVSNMQQLGIRKPRVIKTSDVAILQPAAPPNEARRILAESGARNDNGALLGISAMRWSYFRTEGESRYQDYKAALAGLADDFIERHNVRVVFLPTNFPVHGCREDDVRVATEIASLMIHPEKAHVLSTLCTPAQTKSIMAELEICLVTRMHACVLATSALTPCFSVNYQFKLREFMEFVGLGAYTIDIGDVTYERLREVAERTWNHREEIRDILKKEMNSSSAQLLAAMRELPDLVESELVETPGLRDGEL